MGYDLWIALLMTCAGTGYLIGVFTAETAILREDARFGRTLMAQLVFLRRSKDEESEDSGCEEEDSSSEEEDSSSED